MGTEFHFAGCTGQPIGTKTISRGETLLPHGSRALPREG